MSYPPPGPAAPPAGYGPAAYPPPRRRRRWPWALLITLAVLVGLAVAADRVAVLVADNVAGSAIQRSQGLPAEPDVSIEGFPFLTQVAAGEYDSVRVTAHDIPVGALNLDTVNVHLHDVTTDGGYDTVHAATATADARVGFADLADTLGVGAADSDGAGRVRMAVTAALDGQTVTGSISARVTASAPDGLLFRDLRVQGEGTDVAGVSEALSAVLQPVPLAGLPFDVQVTGVAVDADGLVLHLAGRDLTYGTR